MNSELDNRIRATIGVCTHRTPQIEHVECLLRTLTKGDRIAWTWMYNAEALIDRSRNILSTIFHKEKSMGDVLLFVDDDIAFWPKDAERIVEMTAMTHGVVGGFYTTRREGDQFIPIRFKGPMKIEFKADSPPVEAECTSSGFMGIHRDVFDKMVPTLKFFNNARSPIGSFYNFFQTNMIDTEIDPLYMSEDWEFCRRAKQLGFQVMADPTVCVGHIGTKIYWVHEICIADDSMAESVKQIEAEISTNSI